MVLNKVIKNILVVYKATAFDEFKKRKKNLHLSQKKFQKDFPRFMDAHEAHEESFQEILTLLNQHDFRVKTIPRDRYTNGDDFDLIVSVGGDGTFLRSSHGVKDALMFGVNSAPEHSVGALCSSLSTNFEAIINKISQRQYKVRELNRLQISINGQLSSVLALNDVLLANRSPAGTSRYRLYLGDTSEEQKSSGVWVSTASGSTAAILAAGGKKMPRLSKKIQYLVREPYQDGVKKLVLNKGLVSVGQSVKFIIEMHDACLFIDGPFGEIPLRFGDQVTISNSLKPLKVLS